MTSVPLRLLGRDHALDEVDALLNRLRAEAVDDTSSPERGAAERTLLLAGEPGIGKTSLLEAAARRVRDRGGRARWVAGQPAGSDLAFSGLDLLLHPWRETSQLVDHADRSLLETAARGEGSSTGGTLALAAALLRLLSRWADAGPVLVIVDDLQWVDRSTRDLLSLCALRLHGEPVGFLLASRRTGLPADWLRQSTLHVLEGLDRTQAGCLIDALAEPPRGRAREQVLRQAGGNPLALLEFARTVVGHGPPQHPVDLDIPLTERLEQLFAADLAALPDASRRLLLLTAVADLPDLAALADVVGEIGPAGHRPAPADGRKESAESAESADRAWSAAERAGLVALRRGVFGFRHPLIRSAVLAAASFDQRSRAHRLIAAATGLDEDRRAWHLAAATVATDEAVAGALEATAERARRRGGYAAAAQTLERAAQLSPRQEDRVRRLNAAARYAMNAGHPDWVAELTSAVAAAADSPAARAEADLYAGWALGMTSRHDEVMGRLMTAADTWAPGSPGRVLDALATATKAAYLSGDRRFRRDILDRYRRIAAPEPSDSTAWILAGCDPLQARDEALAQLRHGLLQEELSPAAGTLLGAAAWTLDETETAVQLYGTVLEKYRQASTAGANATNTAAYAVALFEVGRWPAALAGLSEAEDGAAAGRLELTAVSNGILAATLAAVRGDSVHARQVLADTTKDFDLPGTRTFDVQARRAGALAALAEGDHHAAYFHLRRLFHRDGSPVHFHSSYYGLADLAASAVRVDRAPEARATLDAASAQLPGTVSLRLHLILCRARGLLAEEAGHAEELLREAAFDPGGGQWPFERALALADLGEWTRRQQRPADARDPLGEALELFRVLGASPWSDRTAAELRATGVDTAEARRQRTTGGLTAQQLAIVRLAAQGLSNKEIGARLFLSPRTVGFHLNRAFPKLGVTSRFQLRDVVA